MEDGYTTTLPLEVCTQRDFVAGFIYNKNKKPLLSHPLGD